MGWIAPALIGLTTGGLTLRLAGSLDSDICRGPVGVG
jgi:hypothetical protein